jgi:non-specific serine/threonine protein kinase
MEEDPIKPTRPSTLGFYRIHEKLGSGGMGEVYLAEDTRLERKLALKLLKPKIAKDRDRMRRFIQEAKTASALNHPNIITIFEIGEADDLHFIATELIEGRTLHQRLNDGPFSVGEAVEVAIQITRGLQAAHEAGIIHRDIKPENVMIRPDGLVKILDFGIAKLSENVHGGKIDAEAATVVESYTHPGIVIVTVSYMSPEHARGLPVDARSDIFSFGILLYELLSGRQPFTGETINHTIVAILEDEPPPLNAFLHDYPAAIESIIRRCLQKRPSDRFQTTAEIYEEFRKLQRALDADASSWDRSRNLTRAETLPGTNTADASGKSTQPSPAASRPSNLTQELTSLIGRESEIDDIIDLLRSSDAPIVTLTGIGGTGKTRLARAVARAALPDFQDGVFFVDLSSIVNPELVLPTIASALGIDEARGRPFVEVIRQNIANKKILLVIDNFEQLLSAASQMSELDVASPDLRILLTSRELLNLSREVEFPVQPLATPSKGASKKKGNDYVEQIRSVESIRLFVDRAKHADPEFELQPANADSIAKICSELEGLPLAIELAAARTKILSPEQIVQKLENRLSLLTRGPRDLPDRQRTMRGAVEWSYDLLDNDEKRVFCGLSVFAGGFTLEAAESVCQSDRPWSRGESVIDIVTSLVEKNLVTSRSTSSGDRRFRMLEVVREFAHERLEAEDDAQPTHLRHAHYFLELAEKAEPHIQAAQSAEWLNRLELDHDNLRAAMSWSLKNSAETAARLATATRNFWLLHSHLTEGYKWLRAANELPGELIPVASRLKLLTALSLMARFLGEHSAARAAYEQALKAVEAANDKRGIAVANRGLGLLALHESDFVAARAFFESGLRLSTEVDDRFGIAVSLNFLGDVARTQGENETARSYFERSLSILRELDNKVALSDNLNNLAAAAFGVGDIESARKYFSEAIKIAQDLGNKITISVSLDGFAALEVEKGNFQKAEQLSASADELRRSIGYEIEPAERRFRDEYIAKLEMSGSADRTERTSHEVPQLSVAEAIDLALG